MKNCNAGVLAGMSLVSASPLLTTAELFFKSLKDQCRQHASYHDKKIAHKILALASLLAAGFLLGNFDGISRLASWSNGDFNGDGKITYQDFALLDAAFANQSNNLAAGLITEHAAQFGAPYVSALENLTAIPEPAPLALLCAGAGLLLRRRNAGILPARGRPPKYP